MSENLGFLTVIEQTPSSWTGGYLVLNGAGRPLEFHCTMPLMPDKIQQILYGDTLQPFLYGERIAQTLIQRSKLPILSILTNFAAVLTVQTTVLSPVIYVFGESANQCDRKPVRVGLFQNDDSAPQPIHEITEELSLSLKDFGIDNAHLRTQSACSSELPTVPHVPGFDTGMWQSIRIGNRLIAAPKTEKTDWEQLIAEIKKRAQNIDLLEPFARIRLALDEAKNAA